MVLEDKSKFSFFRKTVQIANISAKLAFLRACLLFKIIPIGFFIKFSLQSGLSAEDDLQMESSVQSVLSKTSLELMSLTKDAETLKAATASTKLMDICKVTPFM